MQDKPEDIFVYQSVKRYSHPCKSLFLLQLNAPYSQTKADKQCSIQGENKGRSGRKEQLCYSIKHSSILKRTSQKNQNVPDSSFSGWVGCQRGIREKSCFGRTVWKIPGKFRFSFLLLARDTLNSYHHLHHACNRCKNTHVPGQRKTTLERRTASVCFIMRDFSSWVTKVLQSQIVNWLKNQSESSLHCKLA